MCVRLLKNKKVIFLDGDGTLWYPKKTRRHIAPHWIYKDTTIGDAFLKHIILIPSVLQTLKILKQRGYILILISTHPHTKKVADVLLKNKVYHFRLENLLDAFYTSRDYPEGKGERMADILKKRNIPKSRALMIGDSYAYDYMSAKKVGIDCFLINSEYLKPEGRRVKRLITDVKDVLPILSEK